MITKLTKKQEALIPEIVDKWIKIGLSTEQLSIKEIKQIIKKFDEKVLSLRNDRPIIVFNSPIEAWTFICENQSPNQIINSQIWMQIWDQVHRQPRNQINNQIWNQFLIQIRDQVGDIVGDGIGNRIRDQVLNKVADQVWCQIGIPILNYADNYIRKQGQKSNSLEFAWPSCQGSFDAEYFAWLDFYRKIGLKNLPSEDILDTYFETSKVGLIYPLENLIVVTQKPNFISKNSKGLHSETGPALTYNDNGLSDIYALNGVIVTKEQINK